LQLFLPAVRDWFQRSMGEPTPAQRLGWPAIASGQNTLILAPTGSGKTLAAFLACLDQLWRQPSLPSGVSVLYISPLKALNNDIERNLRVPLFGVVQSAFRMGQPLPELEVAVRTGDTSAAERQRLVRKPPHVLITTPESLHLLLTSRARETLRNVKHCIIDEIHALCPNKRGAFLALLLERLEVLNPRSFIRIGLSATQRPLDEVARYLGGRVPDHDGHFKPRPVTIIDAGMRKDLDLRVVSPVEQFGPLPERSVWPAIYRQLADLVRQHRSTLIFANNRRTVERITACLNEIPGPQSLSSANGEADPIEHEHGPTSPLARAHHGSVALDIRHGIEQAMKEGRLPAVVATASLEMGIDMGAVDLVCQVESPGSVARALQRVGRAGHLVGARSKGRLIAKMASDLLEQAVLAREMLAGRVEEVHVPINCLDVLAQQVVAMVAMEPWSVPELHAVLRRAYPFRDLSAQALESVLEMVAGRYRWQPIDSDSPRLAALEPRISWDRVHNRLHALPGSQHLALVSGGVIPDTGQYAAWTTTGVRIGELDEEFIYESRIGDTFLLGTNSWRLENIEVDRVIVRPAEGVPAVVPFWKGEQAGRSYDLGLAIGRFLREFQERIDRPDCQHWLEQEYCLEPSAARSLRHYVQRQLLTAGSLPTDQTLFIEAWRDELGDWQILLLSPFGQRLHLALRLGLEARLRQRLGYSPQCLHHNDGILVRLTDTDEPILDLFDGLAAETVEDLILQELGESALFAIRFRQNAARALLLPRLAPGKRAPLWLQRLRGRDLLQVARRHPDFPIVVETFRECLHDHLDVPRLRTLLADIQAGRIQVVCRRADAPSPFTANLLFAFTAASMYQYDQVDSEPRPERALDRDLLDQLVGQEGQAHLLDSRAIQQVERRLRGLGRPPRTAPEMAEWLRRLGDMTEVELEGPMQSFLQQLEREGTAARIELPGGRERQRWVLTEETPTYRIAFGMERAEPAGVQRAGEAILHRFLATHALVGLDDLLERYPFEETWARRKLEEWAGSGRVVSVRPAARPETAAAMPRWSAPENLQQVQRSALAFQRSEVITCSPQQFADFVLRWQRVHPEARVGTTEGLSLALHRLEGLALPVDLWEHAVLPMRVLAFQQRWLEEKISGGEWVWTGQGDSEEGRVSLTFWQRENLGHVPKLEHELPALDPPSEQVLECLQSRGASFVADLAQAAGLAPATVRSSLWQLVRRGLVTNDQWEVVRRGEPTQAAPGARSEGSRWNLPSSMPRRRVPRPASLLSRPEGRWSKIAWGHPDTENLALFQAEMLLNRYGIAARELAQMDSRLLPWRVLYEVLSRMELADQVRRGYFVEGLSGAQFALPEASRQLQELHVPSTAAAPVVLLNALDPANMYGAGAPLDVPLVDSGTRPLLRRGGNWLVLQAGRPVLIVEQHGKRLTAPPAAPLGALAEAVKCLPNILGRPQSARHKLTVEEWNGQPVTSTPGGALLEAAGFVRDYQFMTLYAAWQ
jgi:ATP-dependent Lhr-like helicase